MDVSITARQLKELREAAGITQDRLGEEIGLSQKQIEACENGRKVVTDEIEIEWRRAIRRIAWARAVAVGAVPRTLPRARPEQEPDQTDEPE